VGLSSRQLQRKLGALTGLKPLDFIKRVRLEHAAHMLHAGGAGISEIAYAVGFENPAWFSKQFRKVYGMSPSAYAAEQVQATAHPRGR
jgi:AraC-like DNA-binding protein